MKTRTLPTADIMRQSMGANVQERADEVLGMIAKELEDKQGSQSTSVEVSISGTYAETGTYDRIYHAGQFQEQDAGPALMIVLSALRSSGYAVTWQVDRDPDREKFRLVLKVAWVE